MTLFPALSQVTFILFENAIGRFYVGVHCHHFFVLTALAKCTEFSNALEEYSHVGFFLPQQN